VRSVVPDLADDALRLLTFASFGGPTDSLSAIAQRIRARRDPAQPSLLSRPILFAFPVLGAPPGGGPLYELEQALFRGDTVRAQAAESVLVAFQRLDRPGDIGSDGALLRARLALQCGDTAHAKELLDAVLRGMPSFGRELVTDIPQAAAVGRTLSLAAMLNVGPGGAKLEAERRGLWRGADVFLLQK
jgi:hypothetical protein